MLGSDAGENEDHQERRAHTYLWTRRRYPLPHVTTETHRAYATRYTIQPTAKSLETYQTVVNLIANTTTKAGLTVRCQLDLSDYPTKIKVTKREREEIPLVRHDFHGDWNYSIRPSAE